MAEEREYGVAATFDFPLVVFGSTDADFSTGVSFDVSAGDIRLSKDGSTWATINDTTPTAIGINAGIYTIDLDSTEMQFARGVIAIIDQTSTKIFEDQAILLATYGSTAALHAFNRNSTGPNVNAASLGVGVIGSTQFGAGAINSTAIATDALSTDKFTAGHYLQIWSESTRSLTKLGFKQTSTEIATGAITSTKFSAGAINSAAIASGAITAAKFGIGAISPTVFAAGAIGSTVIANGAFSTDKFTDGHYTKIWNESTRSLTKLGATLTDTDFAAGFLTSTKFATGALSSGVISSGVVFKIADEVWDTTKSSHVAGGSFGEEVQAHALSAEITSLNDLSAADVNFEMLDVLTVDLFGEPHTTTSGPIVSETIVRKLGWVYGMSINRLEITSTAKRFFTSTDGLSFAKVLTDDGTTYTEASVTT